MKRKWKMSACCTSRVMYTNLKKKKKNVLRKPSNHPNLLLAGPEFLQRTFSGLEARSCVSLHGICGSVVRNSTHAEAGFPLGADAAGLPSQPLPAAPWLPRSRSTSRGSPDSFEERSGGSAAPLICALRRIGMFFVCFKCFFFSGVLPTSHSV